MLALVALLAFRIAPERETIAADVRRWAEVEGREGDVEQIYLDLVADMPEFRSLAYHRLYWGGGAARVLGRLTFLVLPRQQLLYLSTRDIGPGLYIQHGFGTGVFAQRIGANVWINHQVTVGATPGKDGEEIGIPVIEDGATLYTGARVIGAVRVGRDAVVGANAVVTRDVPDGALAVGVPAQIRERKQPRDGAE